MGPVRQVVQGAPAFGGLPPRRPEGELEALRPGAHGPAHANLGAAAGGNGPEARGRGADRPRVRRRRGRPPERGRVPRHVPPLGVRARARGRRRSGVAALALAFGRHVQALLGRAAAPGAVLRREQHGADFGHADRQGARGPADGDDGRLRLGHPGAPGQRRAGVVVGLPRAQVAPALGRPHQLRGVRLGHPSHAQPPDQQPRRHRRREGAAAGDAAVLLQPRQPRRGPAAAPRPAPRGPAPGAAPRRRGPGRRHGAPAVLLLLAPEAEGRGALVHRGLPDLRDRPGRADSIRVQLLL
mmetsp:Transcript_119803/g.339550  ORF Transcript_119803/g.339550 Transcript_119803/m.339550 type:complete len:298 (+) Transcript_119803:376-1269(+)